jgi:hypothetical protein
VKSLLLSISFCFCPPFNVILCSDPTSHIETVQAEEPEHIRISKLRHSTPTHRVYLITCLHLGEQVCIYGLYFFLVWFSSNILLTTFASQILQIITVEVSNKVSKTLPSPVTVRTQLHFACRLPSTFFLLPVANTKGTILFILFDLILYHMI